MAEHPNIQLFRGLYDAFTSGDMERVAGFFSKDIVWHTPGSNPLSGDYVGPEATLASFAKELELSGGTSDVTIHDVLATDDHLVALLHSSASREGKRLDADYALIFHVRDAKIVEAWEAYTDEAALDEFWS